MRRVTFFVCILFSMLIILGCPGPKEYQNEEWLVEEINKIDTLITSDNQDDMLSHLIGTHIIFEGRIQTIATGADDTIEDNIDGWSDNIIAIDTQGFRVIFGDRKISEDVMSTLNKLDLIRVYGKISHIDFLLKWPVRIVVLKKIKVEKIQEE